MAPGTTGRGTSHTSSPCSQRIWCDVLSCFLRCLGQVVFLRAAASTFCAAPYQPADSVLLALQMYHAAQLKVRDFGCRALQLWWRVIAGYDMKPCILFTYHAAAPVSHRPGRGRR